MDIEQYVMAYEVEQDRLRALLPDGFISLRPVLRINAEVRCGKIGYVEFNTPVEKGGTRGWLNIGYTDTAAFVCKGQTITFTMAHLTISFTSVGIAGSCPAEKDNAGCFFLQAGKETLRRVEEITANKEFCDCRFAWRFGQEGAQGISQGKTLPAYPTEVQHVYPKEAFTVENAAKIPCQQVLGTYKVLFTR